ncbi:hypothetical protein KJ742_01940 [Patescibacteria group bacterium]|nr:hypothetical protein [Patescibacteria group bacterium]MBU1682684.1 hypothetical protein [Patescibacteria group bacterium]MBU1934679.1 hypothetical protein [Patescibacteria group bacterium]
MGSIEEIQSWEDLEQFCLEAVPEPKHVALREDLADIRKTVERRLQSGNTEEIPAEEARRLVNIVNRELKTTIKRMVICFVYRVLNKKVFEPSDCQLPAES